MTQQTIQIPETIKCTFDVSGARALSVRACGLPAVLVAKSLDYQRKTTSAGRCKRHAGIDQRRKYGWSIEIVEFTPEIIAAMEAEIVRIETVRAEERARKHAEYEKQVAATKIRRAAEAEAEYVVTRKDDRGEADWDAYQRQAGPDREMVYGPSIPKWYAHPAGEEPGRGFHEASVKVERKADFPTTIELRASSSLDIAQAKALAVALVAAIAEAERS